MSTCTLYTIGHSNRKIDELFNIINHFNIHILVDIRSHPYSQRHPQFSMDSLREGAERFGMVYHWAGRQLGGKRKSKFVSPHTALNDMASRAFADYMQSEAFQKAVVQLMNLAMKSTTMILCAEKLVARCHRSFISDYLVLKGVNVLHVTSEQTTERHQLSSLARTESATLIYDRLPRDLPAN